MVSLLKGYPRVTAGETGSAVLEPTRVTFCAVALIGHTEVTVRELCTEQQWESGQESVSCGAPCQSLQVWLQIKMQIFFFYSI